jgi:hypothetical protein
MAEKNKVAKATKKEKETEIDKKLKKSAPFLIWLGVLAVVFVVSYFAFRNLGKIEYQGLEFKAEKFGSLLVYAYDYLVRTPAGIEEKTLYFRVNPTENNVSVNGEITYPGDKEVYISSNSTGLMKCEDTMIALANLVLFLQNSDITVKSGTLDEEEAQAKNYTYATCANHPDNPVIEIRAGNETKIENSGICYDIEIANCEMLPALEKFIVQSIIDSQKVL